MTIKLAVNHLPKNEKIVDIKNFFSDVKIAFIKKGNFGKCHIEVKNEENANKALEKNQTLYKKRVISVKLMSNENTEDTSHINEKPEFPKVDENVEIEKIKDTGRLYIRNLDYSVTEKDVVDLFQEYGDLVEVSVPFDNNIKRIKAFGFVTFMLPRDAVAAYRALNQSPFKGRKIQILPGQEKPEGQLCKGVLETPATPEETGNSSFKTDKLERQKAAASSSHNWNALFVSSDVVAQFLADNMGVSKSSLFFDEPNKMTSSISVRLAQAETQLVALVEKFLVDNCVRIDRLESFATRTRMPIKGADVPIYSLSSTTFIVKNLNVGVTLAELEELFGQYDGFQRVLLPPYGVTAIVFYELSQKAKVAYQECAYAPFKDTVLMLQWAPIDLIQETSTAPVSSESAIKESKKSRKRSIETENINTEPKTKKTKTTATDETKPKEEPVANVTTTTDVLKSKEDAVNKVTTTNEDGERSTKVLIKNISFQATQKELEDLVAPFKGVTAVRMPRKPTGGHKGFAFVEFETEDHAQCLMDAMSARTHFLGRRLVLQYSNVA